MLEVIAAESRDVVAFARRAEAWAAAERRPPSDAQLARAWQRTGGTASIRFVVELIEAARIDRIMHRQRAFDALIKGAP